MRLAKVMADLGTEDTSAPSAWTRAVRSWMASLVAAVEGGVWEPWKLRLLRESLFLSLSHPPLPSFTHKMGKFGTVCRKVIRKREQRNQVVPDLCP